MRDYQKIERGYEKIIKYSDEVNRLLILDKEIVTILSEYNSLQNLIANHSVLSLKYKDLKTEIIKLGNEFLESMPDACPLFDIPCDHIKERKNDI
ncbi:hypothetical protein LCGC14_2074450 [marine sediment metagenome]|uniref:Uncharacterized protein n=1 Tax=marine sediment metagenome TaxID=412755 RepID=A0A0F9EHA4_9ZZZZ